MFLKWERLSYFYPPHPPFSFSLPFSSSLSSWGWPWSLYQYRFLWCWGSKPGVCACWANALQTELCLHPLPLSFLIICCLSPGALLVNEGHHVYLMRKWVRLVLTQGPCLGRGDRHLPFHFKAKESEVDHGWATSLSHIFKVRPRFYGSCFWMIVYSLTCIKCILLRLITKAKLAFPEIYLLARWMLTG